MTQPAAISLRATGPDDTNRLDEIYRSAFGQSEEALLTHALLRDPTAAPALSLVAQIDGQVQGHILLTSAHIADARAWLLCPLAVHSDAQGRGVGTALVLAAQAHCNSAAIGPLCVLGDPGYYGKFGFVSATLSGVEPPFVLSEPMRIGWQIWQPEPSITGRFQPAQILRDPLYWSD